MAAAPTVQTKKQTPGERRKARDESVRKNREAIPADRKEAMVVPQDFPKGIIVPRLLLITGCPRSGTRAIAAAFTNVRFWIGHERGGSCGISSSFFAVFDWHYPGAHRAPLERYRFDQVWHQTRYPLNAISSMADKMPDSWWHWQEKHSGVSGDLEPVGLRCALFWIRWNRLVEENHLVAWQYRIEDARRLWPEMCKRLGLPECDYTPDDDHGHNKKKDDRHQFSWDEMKSIDVDMYDDLRQLAEKYGYEP
jgi:hypothetical protein